MRVDEQVLRWRGRRASAWATAAMVALLAALLAGQAAAATRFVAPSGNDGNPGTLAQPWRTVQKAADTAAAGDTVLVRAGIYGERVTIRVSGNATSGFITFRNYPGETPVLDGTGVPEDAGNGDKGGFYLFNRSYIRIQGFEIRDYRTASSANTPGGIWVVGIGSHIEIISNRVHGIATTAADGNAHAIAFYGTGAPASLRDILIQGNRVYANRLGFSEAVVLNGNVQRFSVVGNRVHDNDNIGIDAIGFEGVSPDPAYDQARNGVISGNMVYANSSADNPAYAGDLGADGIYVDGGRDIVIEGNFSYRNDIGIETASEHAGRGTTGITVRNNFVYRNAIGGILMGGFNTNRGYAERIRIVGNTLFENDRLQWGLGEILLQHDVRNSVIKNNIVRANTQGRLVMNPFLANTGNTLDYNLYWAPAGTLLRWQWTKTFYTTLAAWRGVTGGEGHTLVADPKLVSTTTPDLHLAAGSPAIDAGQNTSLAGSQDIDGAARITGARIDIGADERAP